MIAGAALWQRNSLLRPLSLLEKALADVDEGQLAMGRALKPSRECGPPMVFLNGHGFSLKPPSGLGL